MEITLLFLIVAGMVALGVVVWTRTGKPADEVDLGPITGELTKLGERVSALSLRVDQGGQAARSEADARDERQRRELGNLIATMRQDAQASIVAMRSETQLKLDEIRGVVNDQLQKSLETRLGSAFQEVNQRMDAVQKGLGEMQRLAQDVGNLNRTLTNVKTRGIFGELQLERLLEDVLAPTHYEKNVQCKEGSREVVEFAVKLPGRRDASGPVYLPIDSKFPREAYDRLLEASARGDKQAMDEASDALEAAVKGFAKEISEKYISPPRTTDFALLFLPTESLFAEIARRPGLLEKLSKDYRITVTSPSTLGMILNALNMGFRTLMVEERFQEVRGLLSAVRAQFHKFGESLESVQKKLESVQTQVEKSKSDARKIGKKLNSAELPTASGADMQRFLPEGPGDEASDDDGDAAAARADGT